MESWLLFGRESNAVLCWAGRDGSSSSRGGIRLWYGAVGGISPTLEGREDESRNAIGGGVFRDVVFVFVAFFTYGAIYEGRGGVGSGKAKRRSRLCVVFAAGVPGFLRRFVCEGIERRRSK